VGKQRALSLTILDVWQAKRLRADFSDVWQGKGLDSEKEVEERKIWDAKSGKRTEAVAWRTTITAHFTPGGEEAKLYGGTKKSPCTPRVDREAEGRLTAMGSSCSVIQLFSKDQYLDPVVVLSFA
jgi:hypothetical protein